MNGNIKLLNQLDIEVVEQMANVALVLGIIGIFQGVTQIGFWIGVIALVVSVAASVMVSRSHQHRVQVVEKFAILGMIIGILGMLQPWQVYLYQYGFLLLFASTITFIVVSHISVPKKD